MRKKEILIQKPIIITFQMVNDQINNIDLRCLEILHKMRNPSSMNIYSFAALVSLFAGMIKAVPGELLDEKDLGWDLLSLFLTDVHKFIEYLRKYKEFIMQNKITTKNVQVSHYWLNKYQLIQWDNSLSLSQQFVNIAQNIIKLDKSQNYKLPLSPARSLSASPSPLNNRMDQFDEIDEVKELIKSPKPNQTSSRFSITTRTPKPQHKLNQSQPFLPPVRQSQQIKVVQVNLKKK